MKQVTVYDILETTIFFITPLLKESICRDQHRILRLNYIFCCLYSKLEVVYVSLNKQCWSLHFIMFVEAFGWEREKSCKWTNIQVKQVIHALGCFNGVIFALFLWDF